MHPSTTANYIDEKLAYCWPHSKTILLSVQPGIHAVSYTDLRTNFSGPTQLVRAMRGPCRTPWILNWTDTDTRSWKIWYGTQHMTTPRTKNKITIFRCRSVHRSDSILCWLFPFPPYCESRDSRENRIFSVSERRVGVLHGDAGIESVKPLEPFLIGPLLFTL